MMQSVWSAQQIRGGRSYQEDFFAVIENDSIYYKGERHLIETGVFPSTYTLYLLADGMGGMGHGDLAAATVIENFFDAFIRNASAAESVPHKMFESLRVANNALGELVDNDPDLEGMGCTLIAVLWDSAEKSIRWLSVGDSPLWLLRDGRLQRLNEIHSWGEVNRLKQERGEIVPEGTVTASNAEYLASAVSGGDVDYIDISNEPFEIRDKDILVLASDGMETLSDQFIQTTLNVTATKIDHCVTLLDVFNSVEAVRSSLLSLIEQQNDPAQDNATLLVGAFLADDRFDVAAKPDAQNEPASDNDLPVTRKLEPEPRGGDD